MKGTTDEEKKGAAAVARRRISLGYGCVKQQLPPAGFDSLVFVRASVAVFLSYGRFDGHPMLVSWRTHGNSTGTRIFCRPWSGKALILVTQMEICLNQSRCLLRRFEC